MMAECLNLKPRVSRESRAIAQEETVNNQGFGDYGDTPRYRRQTDGTALDTPS